MPNIRKPIFVVPLDLGTITTGNEASGFPASSLNRHKAIGLIWKSSGASNVWARCNLGALQTIDFVSLVAANPVAATTIRVRLGTSQAEVDGTAPYDSGVLPFVEMLDDGDSPALILDFINNEYFAAPRFGLSANGLYNSHLELELARRAQWIRIDIGSHTGDFRACDLIVGQKIEPSRFYDFEFEYGAQQLGSIDFTRFGVVDEQPGTFLRVLSFAMSWMTEAEYEVDFRPLIERAAGTVLFVCFDPAATPYRQNKTYLGFLDKPPFTKGHRKPGYLSQQWRMLSLI